MEQHRNKMKINLRAVFTPVLCRKAENISNIYLLPQFYHEFLLEISEKARYLRKKERNRSILFL